jgi:hypothetical protein
VPAVTGRSSALPSVDWNGKAVYRELRFDARAGTFGQQLTNPDDSNVPAQTGTFAITANPVADPARLMWESARPLGL